MEIVWLIQPKWKWNGNLELSFFVDFLRSSSDGFVLVKMCLMVVELHCSIGVTVVVSHFIY